MDKSELVKVIRDFLLEESGTYCFVSIDRSGSAEIDGSININELAERICAAELVAASKNEVHGA